MSGACSSQGQQQLTAHRCVLRKITLTGFGFGWAEVRRSFQHPPSTQLHILIQNLEGALQHLYTTLRLRLGITDAGCGYVACGRSMYVSSEHFICLPQQHKITGRRNGVPAEHTACLVSPDYDRV